MVFNMNKLPSHYDHPFFGYNLNFLIIIQKSLCWMLLGKSDVKSGEDYINIISGEASTFLYNWIRR